MTGSRDRRAEGWSAGSSGSFTPAAERPLARLVALGIATGAGVGYIPFAPGTFGSAAGLVLYAAVRVSGQPWLDLAAIPIVYLTGVWAAGMAERHFGHDDPGPVVIDEILGMLLTLLLLPVGWTGAFVGFVLFRIFDVLKPPPCRRAEKLPGGWGVMTDDVLAALYAHVGLRLLIAVAPSGMF
jgi:phosphatidylglycerophosphatase A